MKKKIILICLIVTAILITGCGPAEKHYEPEDYILETDYSPDYRILQLTDIHLSNKDNRQRHYDFLDLVIDDADPDLIVITGDLFTFADRRGAREFIDFMNGNAIPWTVTFGNHDEQCYFSVDWLTKQLNEAGPFCLFKDLQDDDVFGNSNFAIDLMEDGRVREQIILVDSNRYNFGEYTGYDYIKQDQIDWYEDLIDFTAAENGGETVRSLLFFHIPVPEFRDAWDAAESGSADGELIIGDVREEPCSPDINSGFFDKILEKGSTDGIFVGHDHRNNFCVKYKGILMGYGVTSTDRVYYEKDLLGGQVITVAEDNSISVEQIIRSYEEAAK